MFEKTNLLIFVFLLILLLVIYFRIFFTTFNRNEIKRRKQNRSGTGYIYWYRGKWEPSNFHLLKIGRTNDIRKRMSAANTSNPNGIYLVGCVRVKNDVLAERLLHRKWAKRRVSKKNEWFRRTFLMTFYLLSVKDYKLTNSIRNEIETKRKRGRV